MNARPLTMPQLSNRYTIREHAVRSSTGPGVVRVCRAYWVRGKHMQPIQGAEAASAETLRTIVKRAYPEAEEVARDEQTGEIARVEPPRPPRQIPPIDADGPVTLSGRQINRNIGTAMRTAAQGRPVTVTMLGQPYVVVLSYPEYLRLAGLDDTGADERHARLLALMDGRYAAVCEQAASRARMDE